MLKNKSFQKPSWSSRVIFLTIFSLGIFSGFLGGLFVSGMKITVATSEIARNFTLVIGSLLGAGFLAWRTFLIDKQTQHTKEDLITRRIREATKNLSASNTVPRYEEVEAGKWQTWEKEVVDVGARNVGLLALENITLENENSIPIIEIVSEYISRRSQEARSLSKEIPDESYFLSSDIDSAIRIISEIAHSKKSYFNDRKYSVNIMNAELPKANLMWKKFIYFDFSNTNFSYSNLTGATLILCWLEKTNFRHAIMEDISLYGSSLRGANLSDIISLSSEDLKITYGVKTGPMKTIIPSHINIEDENIKHWYEPKDPNEVGDRAFFIEYRKWLIEELIPDHPIERYVKIDKHSLNWVKSKLKLTLENH